MEKGAKQESSFDVNNIVIQLKESAQTYTLS